MRYALFLPIFDALADPIVVARLSVEAEAAGWDGVFVWDHVRYGKPVVEVADPWITLAAIASATERIRIGPMVTPLPRRRPAKVARETATLDRLSGGRLTLGVGIASDDHRELSGTGEQLDARSRGAMLDESLDDADGRRAFPIALEPFAHTRFEMAAFAKQAADLGVGYVGICCGGAPHYVRAMAEALGRNTPASRYSPALDLHPVLGVVQDTSTQQVMGDWSVQA